MFTSHRTTRIALCCCAAVLAGCAKKDEAAVDTTAMSSSSTISTTPAAPTPINLADVAGKWDVRAVPTSGDTTPTTYVLTAMGTPDGWNLAFPGRKATVPVHVTTDADSIIVTAGPYASVRRKGVQVTTNGSLHLQNGDLVGTTTAHYNVKTPDSVLTLNVAGTRKK